ncbi:MAG: RNA polymerase sigma-70 factor [Thermoflexibacter sp.]|jgi:RNA polymerase sigma-70 factor (ECF subfamily)|nr:RNA polymerase sigma-70 factor [Thermoflexibacter sp.]
MQVSNLEVIIAIKQDSERTFEQVFHEYYEKLSHYAYSFLKDMDEAEEIVQGIFYCYWEKRKSLEITTSLKSYLYKMVYNRCLNVKKHEKVRIEYQKYKMVDFCQSPNYTSDIIERRELEKQIDKAIEGLPEQCRIIFKMSRFDELKYSEIAEQLGISPKTVENQMGKALKVLRRQLIDYYTVAL